MSRTPTSVRWNLGSDEHNRPFTLTRKETSGRPRYELARQAVSQLDASVTIDSIPLDVLKAIAEIADEER